MSTNFVGLCSSITLVTRLSGRGESLYETVKIIMGILLQKRLPEHCRMKNLIALDRGYLKADLISFLSKSGATIIGTHQRIPSFPFNHGTDLTDAQKRGRWIVSAIGAKSLYVATRSTRGTGHTSKHHAIAYRMGNGRAACLYTNMPDVDIIKFIYVQKRGPSRITDRAPELLEWLDAHVVEVTGGQGGMEWHILRAAAGTITSTVASIFLKLCQHDATEEHQILFEQLGIQPSDRFEPVGSHQDVEAMTVPAIKKKLKDRGLSTSGSKPELVSRLLGAAPLILNLQEQLMKTW